MPGQSCVVGKFMHENASSPGCHLTAAPPCRRFHGAATASAFSLIELLVVLAIAGVLLAIFLPAASGFVQKGQNAKCLGNLRTISTGLQMYIADKGYYPGASPEEGNSWENVLADYIQPGNPYDQINPPPNWLRCPSRRGCPENTFVGAVSYGYNYAGFGDQPPGQRWDEPGNSYMKIYWHVRPSQVQEPSKVLIIGESADDGMGAADWQHRFLYNAENHPYQARRHDGSGNYLYADGHIETMSPAELAQKIRDTSRNIWFPFRP